VETRNNGFNINTVGVGSTQVSSIKQSLNNVAHECVIEKKNLRVYSHHLTMKAASLLQRLFINPGFIEAITKVFHWILNSTLVTETSLPYVHFSIFYHTLLHLPIGMDLPISPV